ncbi:hypothetical protein BDY21DRAFT_123894 [Lineolata rhizophorae]|uniref:Uncharacterized protein n=1 Tax=Lineolata rhizophorae TaxID=578093 RepID=A0A6A6NPM5_9PEZI|nr:hypothetical protein BDY21DRAFT_123894 [Lineolata rhizophorae]
MCESERGLFRSTFFEFCFYGDSLLFRSIQAESADVVVHIGTSAESRSASPVCKSQICDPSSLVRFEFFIRDDKSLDGLQLVSDGVQHKILQMFSGWLRDPAMMRAASFEDSLSRAKKHLSRTPQPTKITMSPFNRLSRPYDTPCTSSDLLYEATKIQKWIGQLNQNS